MSIFFTGRFVVYIHCNPVYMYYVVHCMCLLVCLFYVHCIPVKNIDTTCIAIKYYLDILEFPGGDPDRLLGVVVVVVHLNSQT